MDINHENAIYNVGINMLPGIGSVGVRTLISQCGSAKAVFEQTAYLEASGLVSPVTAQAIARREVLRQAEEQISICRRHNILIHTYQDTTYPRKLAASEGAPSLIYSLGAINLDRIHTVGIVGTRSCDGDGRSNIFALVEQLKADNINAAIISGLAAGADTYAHQAAIKYGLPTVAVLGHGLHTVYPAENRKLAADIVHAGGALITEYYHGQHILKTNFPRRNRIIAGLCDAIIVAQSKASGGALITANVARDLRKAVFAFPGRISDKLYAGCNQLIAQSKATLITSAEDLEQQMGWTSRNKPIQTSINLEPLSPAEVQIIDILRAQGPVLIDTLATITALPMQQLSSLLFTMELKDLVISLPGKQYEAR